MSGGGWKEPFYKVARQDSRNLADFFNKIGFQAGEDQARYNVKNPGHAVSTAAEYALGGYLGSLLGAGGAAGSVAGETAAPAFEGAIASGSGAAANIAEEQAMQQALQQAGSSGLLANTAAPVTDLSINTVPVADKSVQAGLLDKARFALSSGSGTGKGGLLAGQMGMQMLQPKGQPQMPMSGPRPQGNMEPLTSPYGSTQGGPYGTSAGNSLGINAATLTEEQKRMLRARGINV